MASDTVPEAIAVLRDRGVAPSAEAIALEMGLRIGTVYRLLGRHIDAGTVQPTAVTGPAQDGLAP